MCHNYMEFSPHVSLITDFRFRWLDCACSIFWERRYKINKLANYFTEPAAANECLSGTNHAMVKLFLVYCGTLFTPP